MLRRLVSFFARFGSLRRNAQLYLLSNTLQACSAGAIAVLYTLFLDNLRYGTTFIGLTLFVGTAGGALAIFPASALTRHLGWRNMLLLSDGIGGVAIFFQLLIPTPVVTLVTSLGVGASVAIFLVLNAPFLAAHSAPDQRNALFGLNNALGFLASVVGSLVGGLLPLWIGGQMHAHALWLVPLRPYLTPNVQGSVYQLAMLLAGAVAVPSVLPVLFMRDETPSATGTPELTAQTVALRERVREWRRLARELGAGTIGRFSASQALVGFGAGLFFPYLNIYFVQRLGATTAFYGALTAGVTLLLAVVSLASAPLADRFGRARLALAAQVASLPFMIAMGAAPALAVVATCYVIRSTLMNTGAAPLQAFLMDAVAPERRVVASNVYNVSWQGAWAIGAALGGGLIAVGGYGAPFYVGAACYAISAALLGVWFLPRQRDESKAHDVETAS